jgi:hypothetical protein
LIVVSDNFDEMSVDVEEFYDAMLSLEFLENGTVFKFAELDGVLTVDFV